MISLSTGLSDLSIELGETTTDTSASRIKFYNDAVVAFSNERKWPFLVKTGSPSQATTLANIQTYDITNLTDMRLPGAIKALFLGSNIDSILFCNWEDRNVQLDASVCIDPEQQNILFTSPITTAGQAIVLHYYYIPTRITDTASLSTFPIPDRYRKALGLLAASYVQRSRYLDAQANSLANLADREIIKASYQQSESNNKAGRKFPTFLAYRGFRRKYP